MIDHPSRGSFHPPLQIDSRLWTKAGLGSHSVVFNNIPIAQLICKKKKKNNNISDASLYLCKGALDMNRCIEVNQNVNI